MLEFLTKSQNFPRECFSPARSNFSLSILAACKSPGTMQGEDRTPPQEMFSRGLIQQKGLSQQNFPLVQVPIDFTWQITPPRRAWPYSLALARRLGANMLQGGHSLEGSCCNHSASQGGLLSILRLPSSAQHGRASSESGLPKPRFCPTHVVLMKLPAPL